MNTLARDSMRSLNLWRRWAFPTQVGTRDPRIDLLRGLVFVMLFTVHFQHVSALTLVAWERIGVVSSAETFVVLAGFVVGAVYHQKMNREGFSACSRSLMVRAADLYKANLIVILTIGLLRYVPGLDTRSLTTFSDPYTGAVYDLYPPLSEGFLSLLGQALLLRSGPHQFQVIGLYAALFVLSPLVLWAIYKGKAKFVSAASVALFVFNFVQPESTPGTAQIRLTGAQFEYAFPLIAWQLLYVHAMIVGAYKRQISEFLTQPSQRWLLVVCCALSVAFALFSLNHPLDRLPQWAQLQWIAPETFHQLYNGYFLKYKLGPGRLLNQLVLLVAGFALLTLFWKPIERTLGKVFIPLGSNSLYVFTIHIFLLLALDNIPGLQAPGFWLATALHLAMLLIAWLCVKYEILFRWLPR